MKRAPAIFLLALVTGLTGLAATMATRAAWAWIAPAPPPSGAPAAVHAGDGTPPGPRASGGAQDSGGRTVVVLVDGLAAAGARRLPTLDFLARKGGYAVLEPPAPDWPVTAWVSFLTATPPAVHRFLTPMRLRPLPDPNLVATARAAGKQVAVAAEPAFLQLVAPWAQEASFPAPSGWEGSGAAFLRAARTALARQADLTLIQIGGLHSYAHHLAEAPPRMDPDREDQPDDSLTASAEVRWAEALGWLDTRLAAVIGQVDLTRTTVMVVGTYPADARRPHALDAGVPLAVAGPGAGQVLREAPRGLEDLGRSVAALTGAPGPVSPAGQSGNRPGRADDLWTRVRPQLPAAGAALAVTAGYLFLVLRSPLSRPVLWGLVTYYVAYLTLFLLRGGTFSTALPGLETLGSRFWQDRLLQAGIPAVLATVMTGGRLGLLGSRPGHAALGSLHLALSLSATHILQVLGVLTFTGWGPHWHWPGQAWVLKVFLDLIQVAFLGAGGLLWAFVGAVVAALTHQPHAPALSGPASWRRPAGAPVSPRELAALPIAAARMEPARRRRHVRRSPRTQ